jgi:hypothetical protein
MIFKMRSKGEQMYLRSIARIAKAAKNEKLQHVQWALPSYVSFICGRMQAALPQSVLQASVVELILSSSATGLE